MCIAGWKRLETPNMAKTSPNLVWGKKIVKFDQSIIPYGFLNRTSVSRPLQPVLGRNFHVESKNLAQIVYF